MIIVEGEMIIFGNVVFIHSFLSLLFEGTYTIVMVISVVHFEDDNDTIKYVPLGQYDTSFAFIF